MPTPQLFPIVPPKPRHPVAHWSLAVLVAAGFLVQAVDPTKRGAVLEWILLTLWIIAPLMVIGVVLKPRFRRRRAQIRIRIDDDGIAWVEPDRVKWKVAWDDIESIRFHDIRVLNRWWATVLRIRRADGYHADISVESMEGRIPHLDSICSTIESYGVAVKGR